MIITINSIILEDIVFATIFLFAVYTGIYQYKSYRLSKYKGILFLLLGEIFRISLRTGILFFNLGYPRDAISYMSLLIGGYVFTAIGTYFIFKALKSAIGNGNGNI